MNERLSTRNLAELLAIETGMDKKRAEEFIEAVSSFFAEGLERNKVVKIFGLGVFKIMLVRERESVHIQSGERFVIPAHHKLTFVPDKNFKEQINRPFALFEPIEALESDIFEYEDSAIYEDEPQVTPLEENIVYEDEPQVTPLEENIVYEDEPQVTPLEENIVYEDEPQVTPLEENILYEDEPQVTPLEENIVYEDEPQVTPLEENIVYEDEPQVTPLEENIITYQDDYFDIELIKDGFINNDEEPFFEDFAYEKEKIDEPAAAASFNEELPYDLISVATTYTNRSNEIKRPVSEKTDEEYGFDKEKELDNESHFLSSDKKKRKALLWFLLLVIPLCCLFGSVLGGYYFVKKNAEKSLLANQNQDIYQTASVTDNSSLFPVDVVSDSIENIDTTLMVINSNETDLSDTSSTRRQEVQSDSDWLLVLPENVRPNEVRRVNGPNRDLEARNRTLANNPRQASSGNTARTTTDNSSTSSTANAGSLPRSIRMPAGSTLTQIAEKYYGDKVFWVYIYEHNKNIINNFNNVPAGTDLQLPLPSAYGIDPKNAASLQRAREKQSQLWR